MKHVYPWARVCDACDRDTMEFGLVENGVARDKVADRRNNAA
jgi:hypothetical protein